jgi:hypothetical protein
MGGKEALILMTAWLVGSIVCVVLIRSFSATARFILFSVPYPFFSFRWWQGLWLLIQRVVPVDCLLAGVRARNIGHTDSEAKRVNWDCDG